MMTSSVSSSPLSYSSPTPSPELIKINSNHKTYYIEIGLTILFLCLTIPSLFFLTLIYHRETTFISTSLAIATTTTITATPTIIDSSFIKSTYQQKNFYRKSLFNYPQARCMDDSIASYYIRLSNNNNSYWLIYFDGGWFCYSKESCNLRRIYSPNLITSNNMNEKKSFIGIFSSLKQYNIIYVPYCSSDLWSGSSNKTYSHGYDIFHAIFDDLKFDKQFQKAKQIIFTGFSAGGLGLLLNLPNLLKKFSSTIDLRVIIDSGWFIDYPGSINGITKINEAMIYWNTQIPSTCQLKPQYKCFLGSEAIRLFPSHVSILIIQSLFDQTQLHLDKLYINSNDFSLKLIENLRQSSNRISIFAPACSIHGLLFRSLWSQFNIEQRTLASVLNIWLKRTKRTHVQLIDNHFDSSFCPHREDDDDDDGI
ncbi:unnamed protein product [Rotaria sordida]|uniref:Pectin acetylesterase n=1 Tax=Rotaria sordida TaxID=392033 RepID=A0A813VZ50_9BILA|nr:unnamed protein product [Rotaria sordida]CAF1129823.1 unnamed protein product [Rotaria sordida]